MLPSPVTVHYQPIEARKRYPLTISRGVITGQTNLFVQLRAAEVTGLGELCPGALTGAATAAEGEAELRRLLQEIDLAGLSIYEIWQRGRELGIAPCAQAALDMALWDHLGKQAGLPLYRLLGLPRPRVATSITIGINPPELIRERVPEMLARSRARYLKVKLGSPDGIAADQAMYMAAREGANAAGAGLRVDANGGWTLAEARQMLRWLAERECDYVEQPLPAEADDQLPDLFAERPLPIFVDESCMTSADIPRWAHAVDGCNLKLMKCGGITEALRIVAAARAHGLKTMIGCNGESSVSISAGAAISGLFDHIDLDSHLNLDPDPAAGATLCDGVVMPLEQPGLGARLAC